MKSYHIKKLVFILLIGLVFQVKSYAQFNSKIWIFGDSCGISWHNPTLTPVNFISNFKWRNGSTAICDSSGLLAYAGLYNTIVPTNVYVWNKYSRPMYNGDLNYGGWWYHVNLFLPDPGNDSMLFLFSIGVTNDPYGLYYSHVNYKANNDSGIVIQKNVQLNNFPAFDALMAVRHGNGRDWWVIFQRWYTSFTPTNDFYIYLVSPSGISGPNIQSIGSTHKGGGGHTFFNSSGTAFANVSWAGLIELCNFDRCTGTISSFIPVEQEPIMAPYPNYYSSCAFSSDNSKLYVCNYSTNSGPSYLFQFDLNAINISNSKTLIYSFVNSNIGVSNMKLAPDNKIYLSAADEGYGYPYPDTVFTNINSNLSVINQPDSLGLACDFQPFSFYLGGARTYYGLPNNPDYELGAWVGSPCDTLSVGVENLQPQPIGFFQAWYNHEWDMVHVNASGLKGSKGSLRVFDIEGRIVYEKNIVVIAGGYVATEIPTNNFASGIYIVSLVTEKETLSYKLGKL